ncbi:MAG: hypothetical protein CM15mP58_21950 [Burkholderiaceae bacterium]|nr:MAG: hypothetical protein CM15mP58_21950 [Burkholderiaceae bacterium]
MIPPLASFIGMKDQQRIYDGADEVHKSRVAKEIMKISKIDFKVLRVPLKLKFIILYQNLFNKVKLRIFQWMLQKRFEKGKSLRLISLKIFIK